MSNCSKGMPTLGKRSSARPRAKDSAVSRRQEMCLTSQVWQTPEPSLEEPREVSRAGDGHERGGEGTGFHIHTSSHSSSLMSTRNSAKGQRYNLKGREKEDGLKFNLVPTHREGANGNNYLKCHCEPRPEVETMEICTADRDQNSSERSD